MEEEIREDNPQNPIEETIVEETPTEVKETPNQKTDHTDTEKRLYARAKEAEDKAKKLSAELEKRERDLAKARIPVSDVDTILEVTNSTKDLDTDEITELQLRAKALGRSLSEARDDKNFQLWQRGHREEIIKNKALAPNTNQPDIDRPKTFEERLAAAKTLDEKSQILNEAGLNPINIRNYNGL